MKKKNFKPMLISALLAASFGATTIGTSFALFTDSAETSISVTAGKVDVSGGLTGLVVYSAEANASGTVLDENNAKYNLVAQTATDAQGHTLFANKGYAGIATTTTANDTLNLVNVTPGDKVVFKFDMSNASNVTIKYRVVYEVVNTGAGYLDLVKGLTTTIGEESFTGLKTFKSAWTVAENGVLDDVDLSIYLPMDKGNIYQNKAASIKLSVEAVQGNAVTTEGKVVETIEEDMSSTATATGVSDLTLEAKNNEESVSVKTTIPAATEEVTEGKIVELLVSDLTQESEAESDERSLAFDLTLKVNGAEVESFSLPIAVEINIGPGYKITSIYHKDTLLDVGDYTYDKTEGIIRFSTTHFSPFIVNYYVEHVEVTTYEQLVEAAKQAYATIDIKNDIAVSLEAEPSYVPAPGYLFFTNEIVKVAEGVTINGNGYRLYTHAMSNHPKYESTGTRYICKRVFEIKGNDVTIDSLRLDCSQTYVDGSKIDLGGYDNFTFKNCTVIGSTVYSNAGQVFTGTVKNVSLLNNTFEQNFGVFYANTLQGKVIVDSCSILANNGNYTLNFGSAVEGCEMDVKDSILRGRTSYTSGIKAQFTNCSFNADGSGQNLIRSYATVTFDGCSFDNDIRVELVANSDGFFNYCYMNVLESETKVALTEDNFDSTYKTNLTLDNTGYSDVADGKGLYINGVLVAPRSN